MKFENTTVMNLDGALRGMRNPMNSWDKGDSGYGCFAKNVFGEIRHGKWMCNDCRDAYENPYFCQSTKGKSFIIGDNDMKLAQKLIRAGGEHRKFMRQIFVCADITAPLYWWKEFDTYKVATVRNSCSTMHKIHVNPFNDDDFAHDSIDKIPEAKEAFLHVVKTLEVLRQKFNDTQDKTYWRALIQLLPDSFEMKSTLTFNYETLFGICSKGQRRNHKLNEWSGKDYPNLPNFIAWARELPYAKELLFIDESES